ncbi:MAG TPA: DUF2249 domain-containing protein [Lutibacter sp.]
MKINKQTKISALIKENTETIEIIASINSYFNQLRNPFIRKILASRITVGDVARIGKCDITILLKKLANIGFEIETIPVLKEEEDTNEISQNSAILEVINSSKVTTLDVRPALAKGEDPFKNIMGALKNLQEGYALEVINTFEPTPLIKIVNSQGYESMVETKNNVVFTYFLKVAEAEKTQVGDTSVFKISNDEFEEKKANCKKEIIETDVRNLEMPLPMLTILQKLEELKENEALYVHHKKTPQYLLPELKERKFKTWITEIDSENVKLLIHK